jgi:aromatic-amino-acid transaminase
MAPRDPILGLNEQFAADTNPAKVNLGVGVYYDDNGKLPLLKCVQAAEKQMMEAPKAARLPAHRRHGCLRRRREVPGVRRGPSRSRVAAWPRAGIGGTGGLKIGADFLKKLSPNAKVLISDPSWENHRALFTAAGFRWSLTPTTTPPTAVSTLPACWPR